MYKFRTMVGDAEQGLAELEAVDEMKEPLFKVSNDPRVTRVGRWLRRTHLDEPPQSWNVLKGDMSLVGTRPPTEEEVARYRPEDRRRLSIRPGITGLWQVEGNRAVSDFDKVVELDCRYIEEWSIALDVKILLRTVLKVLRANASQLAAASPVEPSPEYPSGAARSLPGRSAAAAVLFAFSDRVRHRARRASSPASG